MVQMLQSPTQTTHSIKSEPTQKLMAMNRQTNQLNKDANYNIGMLEHMNMHTPPHSTSKKIGSTLCTKHIDKGHISNMTKDTVLRTIVDQAHHLNKWLKHNDIHNELSNNILENSYYCKQTKCISNHIMHQTLYGPCLITTCFGQESLSIKNMPYLQLNGRKHLATCIT